MNLANHVPAVFRLNYPAQCAYVFVRAAGDTSGHLAQMEPLGDARWGVTLQLQPGDYWCRYYVNDGSVTILVPGWNDRIVDGACGWDSLVQVVPNDKKPARCGIKCRERQCRERAGCRCQTPADVRMALATGAQEVHS